MKTRPPEILPAFRVPYTNPTLDNMKSTAARIFLPVAALFFLADALNLQAGNILKTNTVTMVNSTDWAPITTPSFGSVGEFGAAPTALQLSTMTLGANMTLGGLQFDSTMLGPVTIAAGNTLTNGGNGINMSLANTNVTINAALALTNNQSWLVTNGLTLTIGASPNFASSGLTLTIAGGGSTTVNGNLVTPTGSDSSVLVTNGNFTATSVNISRSSANQVAFPTPTAPIWAQPGSGFVVNGPATVASLTTLTIASQNSGSTALVTNGANLTVSGKTLVGDMNATSGGSVGRWSVFQVSGGNFTNSDTTAGGGFVMSPNNGTTTNSSELLITGGNAVIAQIALGAKADTVGGTNAIIINGGNLYLGIGGIALSNTHTFYSSNYLVSGLLGATTNWSSSLPMTLANTTGTPFTIQTANGNGVAHNITLGGVISGAATAPLTTGGGGTLTISAAGTYTGNIVITNGTLSDTFQNNNLNITASGLGNPQTAGRTVTILNGGILSFDGAGGNDLGNAASSGVQLAFFITNGTMRLTSGNTPIGPLTLSGGTVTCTAGSGGSQAYYALFYLNGDVTVGGTSPSTISSASTNASGNYINLTTAAAGTRKFTVAQTGGTGPDLFVSAPLGNGSNATNLVANLVKAGAGTMSLSATNSYTGTTTISGGTLALTNNGSINWSTAITISNGATLDVSGVTGGYTLAGASNQTLNAGGVVNGSLNATNNARIYAGTDLGYGTNTFNNNADGDGRDELF
jgi:autotransporter-associated beta strand protein